MTILDAAKLGPGFVVYRPGSRSPVNVTGQGLTLDIQSGSLIISTNGTVTFVFGPNEWVFRQLRPLQLIATTIGDTNDMQRGRRSTAVNAQTRLTLLPQLREKPGA